MRNASLAVAAALVLLACGKPRLEGKWKGLRADGVPADVQGRANDFAMGMSLEIKGDSITVKSPVDTQSGKFKVIDSSKDTVVIVTDKDGPTDKQTFTFLDDKTMKWKVSGGQTITFVRDGKD